MRGPADQALFLGLSRCEGDGSQALNKGHHPSLLIQDRAQFDIDMLRATWRVMNVQYPLRHLAVPGFAHRAMLAGLVAGHGVVMRDLVAFFAQRGLLVVAELAAIGGVGGQDVVVGVQHNGRQGIVLKVGNQR